MPIVIDKGYLDELIRLTRKYAKTGDVDLLDPRHRVARKAAIHTFGSGLRWMAIYELTGAVVGPGGIDKSAPNSVIYAVFEAAGLKVEDVVTEDEDEHLEVLADEW